MNPHCVRIDPEKCPQCQNARHQCVCDDLDKDLASFVEGRASDDDWSEGHEPEMCSTCNGSGQFDDATPCSACDGDGTLPW
jgi:hypothetical protein